MLKTRRHAPDALVWRTFQRYRASYPHHDPDNILESLRDYLIKPDYSEINILPPPFEWVDIPAGKVKIVDAQAMPAWDIEKQISSWGWVQDGSVGGEFDVPAFKIAKYPMTVAQYKLFVEEDGYTNPTYWTSIGWQWHEAESITQQYLWEDEELHVAHHPIIGISFYEALAYANWLKTKTGLNINLPTEQQWQRAALAETNWVYPWGREIDETFCNYSESTIHKTTPVTDYLKGCSPYGVLNMGGNVWEWTQTDWVSGEKRDIDGTNKRVVRGGSWVNYSISLRAAFRDRYFLGYYDLNQGLRLALS